MWGPRAARNNPRKPIPLGGIPSLNRAPIAWHRGTQRMLPARGQDDSHPLPPRSVNPPQGVSNYGATTFLNAPRRECPLGTSSSQLGKLRLDNDTPGARRPWRTTRSTSQRVIPMSASMRSSRLRSLWRSRWTRLQRANSFVSLRSLAPNHDARPEVRRRAGRLIPIPWTSVWDFTMCTCMMICLRRQMSL